ncbi:hypothetical protein WH47_06058 [Habropoda laboriosa]|uniref:Uncharacterized protein n=1 Tax=Habropoda laboriosa TaxID=597456 RepID=A0A0L7QU03_9HYME|nr:hypothetical protein WH47_06058 [Habropoda laboriosa]
MLSLKSGRCDNVLPSRRRMTTRAIGGSQEKLVMFEGSKRVYPEGSRVILGQPGLGNTKHTSAAALLSGNFRSCPLDPGGTQFREDNLKIAGLTLPKSGGSWSVALGHSNWLWLIQTDSWSSNLALDHSNLALDHLNLALDHSNLALGHSNLALGHSNLALGHSNLALDHSNLALDHSNLALGHSNLALGHSNRHWVIPIWLWIIPIWLWIIPIWLWIIPIWLWIIPIWFWIIQIWHWVIQTGIGSFKLALDHWCNQIQGLEDSKLCGETKIRCLKDANDSLRKFQRLDGSERMNKCNQIYVTMSSCVVSEEILLPLQEAASLPMHVPESTAKFLFTPYKRLTSPYPGMLHANEPHIPPYTYQDFHPYASSLPAITETKDFEPLSSEPEEAPTLGAIL